jgi:hypothetical protein
VIERTFETLLEWYLGLVIMICEQFEGPVYVLQYEMLKDNMSSELNKISKFLGTNVTDGDIDCTVKLQEGNFHRNTTHRKHCQLLNFIYQGEILSRIQDTAIFAENMLNAAYNLNLSLRGPERRIFSLRL